MMSFGKSVEKKYQSNDSPENSMSPKVINQLLFT